MSLKVHFGQAVCWNESRAEATAVQTLRDNQESSRRAKRLDCGAFTAAFARRELSPQSGMSGGVP